MLDERKQDEARLHDKLRDESLKANGADYKYLTSNKKYYSVTGRSEAYFSMWLRQRCAGKRCLDYCCGNGKYTIFMAENGAESIGIDISGVSVENCRKYAEQEGVGGKASFYVMDAENMSFEESCFDVIICRGVLHHLDTGRAFKELSRVLKPDGEIICIEPLIYNPVFQLYRRMTPQLRTKWETEHILTLNDLEKAKKFFGKIEISFYHLFTLLAVLFRNSGIFGPILKFLEAADSVAMKLPFLQLMAWQMIFVLSKPKK